MLRIFRRCLLLVFVFSAAFIISLLSSCRSPQQFKEDADKEVYKIIDQKWQDKFGQKTNYKVRDAEPNVPDIAKMIPPNGVLTLRQSVAIATKFNRDYQSQKEFLYQSALNLTLTRHTYELQWLGTFDVDYARTYNEITKTEEQVTTDAAVSASKSYLIGDGIQIATSLALDWTRFLTGNPQESLGSVLNATLTAPLLGAGAGRQARENLTQAERNVLYQIRTFNRYRQIFVTNIVAAYYGVLQQKERVAISEASYRRLIDSTNQLKMEADVGQRPPYDADEAQQRLLAAENSLVSDRQNYEQALDRFKIQLALPTDANITLDQSELKALEKTGVSPPEYTEDNAIEVAMAQRLDLANTRDNLDDAARQLKLAADGLGIQLALSAGANASSPSTGTEAGKIEFNKGNYSLGLQGDLPLDRKAERNTYRTALIAVQQRQRSWDEAVAQIQLVVRQAYRDLKETAESYRIQKVGLQLAERRLDREKLMLEYGQGTVRLLLESEDALVAAQNAVTTALVDHSITKLNFFRDIGVLTVKPDGMWEQGAK
jgi:outer membrane protein TolC